VSEMSFGDIIKKKIAIKGYSSSDLVRMTGKSDSNLSNYKNSTNPTLDTIQMFADALDLTFLITKNEPLKAWDCYQEIDLLGHEIEPELEEFIKTPANEIYLRYAKLVSEYGLNSHAVKEFSRFLPKK